MAATFPFPPSLQRPVPGVIGSGATHALGTWGNSASGAADGPLLATIEGEPWFNETDLNRLARDKGMAFACLEAYRRLGEGLLKTLRGSFALAIIDTSAGTALLATDRVGIRPLAYARTRDGGLVFASTATAVSAHPQVGNQLSHQALFDYAYFHMVPSPVAVYAGVQKMEPAHRLIWRNGRYDKPQAHWLPQFQDRSSKSEAELGREFLSSLRAGVTRAQTSVPTATFLSGGIDSSTVTGLLAEIAGSGRPAYTVGFEEAGYDEVQFAKIAATHFGADLRTHYITSQEVADCIPQLGSLYDEPFGNSSAVPTLICSQVARRDGIEHMLAGDGGDELFAGNVRYGRQQVFEHYWRIPQFMRSALEGVIGLQVGGPAPIAKLRSYMRQARMPMPDRMESYNFLVREGIDGMFDPEFLKGLDPDQPLTLLRARYGEARASSLLDRMLYLDWKFTLADNDLRKVGATCEAAGVVVSFPWLTDELLDLATQVPPQWKMRGGKLRAFAKGALTGFLPDATLTKQKHGFGLPFGEWLKKYPHLQAQVYDLINQLRGRQILRGEFLDKLVHEHRIGHASYNGTMLWVFAMLEAWMQAHRV